MSQEKEKKPNNRRYRVTRIITLSGIFNCKEKGKIVFPPETFNERNIKAIEGEEINSDILVISKAEKDPATLERMRKARKHGVKELGALIKKQRDVKDEDDIYK